MGWVNEALRKLKEDQAIEVRPSGGSMRGRIEPGSLVRLEPIRNRQLREGDVVLVRWKGNYLLHLIKEVQADRYLIGNNLGRINGWVDRADVLAVEAQNLASEERKVAEQTGG